MITIAPAASPCSTAARIRAKRSSSSAARIDALRSSTPALRIVSSTGTLDADVICAASFVERAPFKVSNPASPTQVSLVSLRSDSARSRSCRGASGPSRRAIAPAPAGRAPLAPGGRLADARGSRGKQAVSLAMAGGPFGATTVAR